MRESIHHRYEEWRLNDLLAKYPALRIQPSVSDDLVLSGVVDFRVSAPNDVIVEDAYNIEIRVPSSFPASNPTAYELGSRIPHDYHKLEGNYLCLGAPTALRMTLTLSPTLVTFLERFVIPYLAGYTYFSQHGISLFGELEHGSAGIRQYFRELFHSPNADRPEDFLRLASLNKRCANKQLCPCLSRRRLGKCHNRIVNGLRRHMGRKWFREEYERAIYL